MDFLSKSYGQVADLFRTMTPAARITTALLLAAVVISVTFLFQTQTDVADHYLFGAQELSQRELAAMEIAFGEAGLGLWQVKQQKMLVPRGQKAAYYKALADNSAFPEHPGNAAEKMFSNQSPLESRDLRDKRARLAKQTDMEAIITKWKGIDTAFVMIDEVDNGTFSRRRKLQASVSVQMQGNMQLDEQLATSVRRYVANGAGIDPKDVVVVDGETGRAFGDEDAGGDAFAARNRYAEVQREHESYIKRKIEDYLGHIRGIRVSVFAQLDHNLLKRMETRKYDGQPVTLQSSESTKDLTSTKPPPVRRTGVAGNGGGNAALAVSNQPVAEKTVRESDTQNESVAGTTRELTEMAGLVPQEVRVSVSVPRSHFLEIWQRENPPAEGEEAPLPTPEQLSEVEGNTIRMIENSITNLLPEPPAGVDPLPRVEVQAFTDIQPAPVAGPSFTDTAATWFAGNWQTMGMFALAIFGFVMLRGMLRAANDAPAASPQSIPLPSLAQHETGAGGANGEDDEDDEDNPNSLKARFQHSGRSLRDELTELVREDPDAAANVLKNWIGDAA